MAQWIVWHSNKISNTTVMYMPKHLARKKIYLRWVPKDWRHSRGTKYWIFEKTSGNIYTGVKTNFSNKILWFMEHYISTTYYRMWRSITFPNTYFAWVLQTRSLLWTYPSCGIGGGFQSHLGAHNAGIGGKQNSTDTLWAASSFIKAFTFRNPLWDIGLQFAMGKSNSEKLFNLKKASSQKYPSTCICPCSSLFTEWHKKNSLTQLPTFNSCDVGICKDPVTFLKHLHSKSHDYFHRIFLGKSRTFTHPCY